MSEFSPPVLPRCTKHPETPTGRSCTRCGRPACAQCLQQVAIGSQCLECLKQARPTASIRARDWNASQHLLITRVVMVINLGVFVWISLGNASSIGFSGNVSQRQIDLGLNKALLSQTHEWYRLFTSGFLHFGFLHIAMNMYLLYQLGKMLEEPLGRWRFGLLYVTCLLGGSLGVLILEGNSYGLHGGASGAVFGLMAAAAVGMHRRGVNVFQTGIGATLGINLLLTFTIPGISIGGHVGGAVTGALLGGIMLAPSWKPLPSWLTYTAPIVLALGALVASIIVVG